MAATYYVNNKPNKVPHALYQIIPSPISDWLLGATNKGICFLSHFNNIFLSDYSTVKSNHIHDLDKSGLTLAHLLNGEEQLTAYFDGLLEYFNLELDIVVGTPFQKKTWQALTTINFGDTCSYQSIATQIGNVKACRAVGAANRVNPISIIIPCHRVIGKSGKLIGYANGLDIKEYLLEHESKKR